VVGPLQQSGGFGPAQSVPARGAVASSRFDALRVRFGIEAVSPEATITLDKRINPVQAIEWISPVGSGDTHDINLGSSAGAYNTFVEVPTDERWIVHTGNLEASTAASRLQATISGEVVNLSTSGTSEHMEVGMNVQLEPGDNLGGMHTGSGSDTALEMSWTWTAYKVR